MKRLVTLWIVACASLADAGPVKPPPGWTTDPAAAVSLSNKLGDVPHFGGLRSIVTTEVYRTQGCSLFVTRASTSVAGLDAPARDRAATTEANEVMLAMRRAGGKPASDAHKVSDDNANTLEITHRWHDEITGIATNSRIVVASDAQQMIAVTGECVLAGDVAKDVEAACAAALTTLDPEVPVAARVLLTVAKETGPIAPAGSDGSATAAPSLVDSGERPSLPPMQIPQQQREPDRRPIYVGLGLIVLAVVFYLNRKNREKLEREHEKRTADKPDPPAKSEERDGDADDLHAAAADDGTKEDSKS